MADIAVEYIGDDVEGLARQQASALVWACLRKQKYVAGTLARVWVKRGEQKYAIRAMAKEPNGPPIPLIDLDLPLAGATEADFAHLVQNGDLGAYLDAPDGFSVVGATAPRKTGLPDRNGPCVCGSGRKYKRCHGAERKRK